MEESGITSENRRQKTEDNGTNLLVDIQINNTKFSLYIKKETNDISEMCTNLRPSKGHYTDPYLKKQK